MYRVWFASLAVLVAGVLLSGLAYDASLLAPYLMRAMVRVGPATARIVSVTASLIGVYFAIWVGLRYRSRSQ
jgi:hypothetical protein